MGVAYGGGVVVSKIGVLVAFAGSPRSLFTVNGYIRINAIFGWISTAISANATALDLGFDPTDGALAAIAASTTVTSEPVGTTLGYTGDPADTLTNVGEGSAGIQKVQRVFAPGLFVVGTTGAGATTGAVDWYIEYVPLSAGAGVVLA